MLKLIIVDDERVIRETISSLIDWSSLGIELIGVCKDGIEAYNMILDESPDIVMTDIRMPGLSGIELVKEVMQTKQDIQFIVLSGYDEFEYAREVMKYGVKHYLLKPCSEKNMLESIQQAIVDCNRTRTRAEEEKRKNHMLKLVRQDAMYHMLIEGLSMKEMDSSELIERLEYQMKFYNQTYELNNGKCYLYYIYYLERGNLQKTLSEIESFENQKNISDIFYGLYVNNVLLLFCYDRMEKDDLMVCCGKAASMVEITYEEYQNLFCLLQRVLMKVRRYDTIYAIHNFEAILMINDQHMIQYMQRICQNLESENEEIVQKSLDELITMVKGSSNMEFFYMLGNSICFHLLSMGTYSITEVNSYFNAVQHDKDIEKIKLLTIDMLVRAKKEMLRNDEDFGLIPRRIMTYVEEHLQDSDLTLKKVAEEYLFMNVDYVSRQFKKATNKKFSQYLTEQRIKRAKEILLTEQGSKIQYVAERVGCGNNPQYFSQIFKKIEGTTPGKWLEQANCNKK